LTDADAVTPEQIRETVGLPIAATLPNAYADILQAINKGEPLDPHGKSAFTRRMAVWARNILAAGAEVSPVKASSKRLAFWRK
jgi:hypothetical protein